MDFKPEVETQVRSLLQHWAASFPDNPFPDFGKEVSLVTIEERPSFVIHLRTLYDVRLRPLECTKPYSPSMEGSLTAESVRPDTLDLWSYESPLKSEFSNQEVEIEIPKTFRAMKCWICDGKGNVLCNTCSGNKTLRCPDCQNGKIPCVKCIGRGKMPCTRC